MVTRIDVKTIRGRIPEGEDLVVYERGGDPLNGLVLYGFDEIGLFDGHFHKPEYCFLGTEEGLS